MSAATDNSRFEQGLVLATQATKLLAVAWPGTVGASNGLRESARRGTLPLSACRFVIFGQPSSRRFSRQKRQRLAVEGNEASLQDVADALPQLVWTAQPDVVRDYFNRRSFKYNGVAPALVVQSGRETVVYPGDREACRRPWRNFMQTDATFRAEDRQRRPQLSGEAGFAEGYLRAATRIACYWFAVNRLPPEERAIFPRTPQWRKRIRGKSAQIGGVRGVSKNTWGSPIRHESARGNSEFFVKGG
jgi:PAS domain-containing protein